MADKPHVIILMADQLRWDALGQHSPNINRLLGESFVFERAYCASPLCVPARGSFFTGRYLNETGSIINPWAPVDAEHGNVRAGIPNLYQLLEKDWDSHHTGKQHLFTEEGKLESRLDSATLWSTISHDYREHLRTMNHRSPGGPDYKGIIPEMVKGKTTRMKRYSIPTTGCYEHGYNSFFDGHLAGVPRTGGFARSRRWYDNR